MAMLAEPRRKQRWTLNPRGKDWSNDSNKFGQRMLEKMGWTTGKGLGANEQGMTEHVKIKVKNDTVGIGFKNDQDKAWTEHQKAFDNFLSHLQKNQDSNVIKETETKNSTANLQSLELKSKQSRTRVHYQKFTRGKDVKKYSAKDLADILGEKNIPKKESNTEKQPEKDTNVSNIESTSGGSFTINRGSITDYFKKKTSHFLKDKDNNNTPKDYCTSDSENEQYRGFGFVSKNSNIAKTKKSKLECKYTFDNPALDLHSTNDTIITEENIKGLNKRKGEFFSENDVQNLDHKQNLAKKIKIGTDLNNFKEGFINMALDLDNQVTESHIENKFEIPRVQLGLTNNALDITDETCDKKRVTFNDHVEYSTDSVKKKKCTGKLDKFEIDSKKNRKKRKQIIKEDISNTIGFFNEALDINSISDESRDNETNEYKSKKHKKQKQQRISNLETIQEISEEININGGKKIENLDKNLVGNINKEEDLYIEDIHIKKKKKKAKKYIVVTANIDDDITNMQPDIKYTKKEESEKKGHKRTKMNNCPEIKKEDAEEHQIIQENIADVKSTEASKVKKKQDNKDINKDLGYKLKSRKSKKVPNNDDSNYEEINIVAQESKTNEKHNIIDKSGITNEEVTVKAKVRNNIISKEINTKDNKNDNNSIDIEKNITDTEIRLQNIEVPKINHEDSMLNSIDTIDDNNSLKEKTKMSRRMLKSFLHLSYVSDFPGSNINEIRGYGADLI